MRALLLALLCCSAGATEYNFSGSATVTKTDLGPAPLTDFEDAYWFPPMRNGGTFAISGRIDYQPGLMAADPIHASSIPQVFLDLPGGYEWAVAPTLGGGAFNNFDPKQGPGESFDWVDSFPTLVAGTTPSRFVGEDASVELHNPNSQATTALPRTLDGFSFGDFVLLGRGVAQDPGTGIYYETRVSWTGTIDSLAIASPAPEPSSFALSVFGLAGVLSLRTYVKHRSAKANRL
jgi:hypothetical protein